MPTRVESAVGRFGKVIQLTILKDLSAHIDGAKMNNKNNPVPHKFIQNLVLRTKHMCPWLTCNRLVKC